MALPGPVGGTVDVYHVGDSVKRRYLPHLDIEGTTGVVHIAGKKLTRGGRPVVGNAAYINGTTTGGIQPGYGGVIKPVNIVVGIGSRS